MFQTTIHHHQSFSSPRISLIFLGSTGPLRSVLQVGAAKQRHRGRALVGQRAGDVDLPVTGDLRDWKKTWQFIYQCSIYIADDDDDDDDGDDDYDYDLSIYSSKNL